ncbi:MAG: preprotein translocase subunit YajC [Planctomycetota bacterium]
MQDTQSPPSPASTGDGTTATTGQAQSPGGPPADAAKPSLLGSVVSMAPFLIIILIFYFVMLGPERKQRKKREAMIAAVKKGDKVLTTGGMYASVAAVNEDSITLQASDDVRLRFSRQAIAQVLEPENEAAAKN